MESVMNAIAVVGVWLLLFAPSPVVAQPAARTPPVPTIDGTTVEKDIPYLYLRDPPSLIFVGRITGHTTIPLDYPQIIVSYERGTITLDVRKVLHGDPVRSITLPYFILVGIPPLHMGIRPIWPDFRASPAETLYLVLERPGQIDRGAGDLPGVAGAAGFATKVSGIDDPLVATYQRLLKTDALTGRELFDALMKYTEDPDELTRRYAMECAAELPGRLPKDESITILLHAADEEIALTQSPRWAEGFIQTRLNGRDVTADDWNRVFATYARLASSPDATQRDRFVEIMSLNTQQPSMAVRFSKLDPQVRAQILAAAKQSAASDDAYTSQNATKLVKWLEATTKPTTSPW